MPAVGNLSTMEYFPDPVQFRFSTSFIVYVKVYDSNLGMVILRPLSSRMTCLSLLIMW